MKKKAKRERVLSDHKRIGKKFLPPFTTLMGRLNEVGWVDDLLPEVLWLGMLNEKFGLHRGAELALQTAKAADQALGARHDRWLHMTSQYVGIPEETWPRILSNLKPIYLEQVREALRPLVALYPECALVKLWVDRPEVRVDDVNQMRTAVGKLVDRTSQAATYAQANCVYIMFGTNKLVVHQGSILEKLESVVDYPNSLESEMVASGIRATITGFGSREDQASRDWSAYFWRRGLELAPCEFAD